MGLRGRDIELTLVKCLGQGWTLSNCSSYSVQFSSVQSLSRVQPTLCDPMDCSTPGFPVHHQLRELTQTQCPSSR